MNILYISCRLADLKSKGYIFIQFEIVTRLWSETKAGFYEPGFFTLHELLRKNERWELKNTLHAFWYVTLSIR